MPELLCAQGGRPELLGAQGGCMPDLLGAFGWVCRNFSGLRGGYAGTIVRSGG